MFNSVFMALLLLASMNAFAQDYRAVTFNPAEQDLQTIESLTATRRARNLRAVERQDVWTLFGRVGPMNFTNQLDGGGDGPQITLRRNGHGLSGMFYVGFHRRF